MNHYQQTLLQRLSDDNIAVFIFRVKGIINGSRKRITENGGGFFK